MNKAKTILTFVVLLIMIAIVGRISAHQTARKYGHAVKQAYSMVGVAVFATSSKIRDFFASPDMTACRGRLETLSILGNGYRDRADELQRGMIYLSEQMALAPSERFSTPPSLSYLTILSDDHTDDGVAAAATRLIALYESQL